MPLISIIIAVFNAAETLQKCIDSIEQQTCSNFELIVIDGGSVDGTVKILENNSAKIDYWISEPDKGIYNAWNKGLVQATGEWVCFIGADDYLWDSNVLNLVSRQLTGIAGHVQIAYGRVMVVNKLRENLYEIGEPWYILKPRFKQDMCVPHPGSMHRKKLFSDRGYFDESFKIAGDYEMLLRELMDADAFYLGNDILVGMTHGGMSSDISNALLACKEVRRAQRIHGLVLPSRKWLLTILRVYIRIGLWKIFGESLTRKMLDVGRKIRGVSPLWTKT